MRTSSPTSKFKRDFRRIKGGQYGKDLDSVFVQILTMLLSDEELPVKHRDHPLIGEYSDCRECHIRPDLLLIYRKPDDSTLQLVRLGSHSELFGK